LSSATGRALLYRHVEPVTLHAPQVESMHARLMNNVASKVLNHLGIYQPGGKDVSRHEVPYLLLSSDPTMDLHEP